MYKKYECVIISLVIVVAIIYVVFKTAGAITGHGRGCMSDV